ncbi:restriction endonuclease subunit S [Vibrio chagasii]|uniref:restriction endonuclease subunit S n=1 Tax=Vibrio chagasii TaxID=170679 RepID=UPI003736F34E
MVPNGWEVKSPSKLFKLFSGFAFKSSDAKESGAKWLKIANVGIGEIKWDADSFLPEHFLLEHKKYLLTKGDIVVALTRPTLGNKLKVARLTKDSDTSLLNQRVAKIVCKDNVDSEFTFQVLRSDQFAFRINVGLLGTDPPNLSVKVLEDFTIPVPPLPEQRKIAQILSTWDRSIATTEKLIDASKLQKKALMQQLMGKKRLVNPETGKAFEGDWEEVKLDGVASKVMVGIASAATHAYTDSGIRMLRNLNIKDGWIDDSDMLYISEEYEVQHKNKRLKAGDILTVRTGYPGLSAVVPSKYDQAQCFTSLITRLNQDRAMPEFVCRYINSEYGKKFITSGEAGGAQKNVNAGMLKLMPLPLPSLAEQQKIASVLTAADKEIELLQAKLAHLKQEKKALMQQLLTGKRRVSLSS